MYYCHHDNFKKQSFDLSDSKFFVTFLFQESRKDIKNLKQKIKQQEKIIDGLSEQLNKSKGKYRMRANSSRGY